VDKIYLRAMVKNMKELAKKFPDEASCRAFLVEYRWNGVPTCPYCNCPRSYAIEGGKRFKCANKECFKKYSVLMGTPMEGSNIPLTTWFLAIYMMTAHKKGISSCQLARNVGVTQKTAWFMLMRIREMLREKAPLLLEGEVQADECYIGGSESNKHKDKQAANREEAAAKKMPVVGLLQTKGPLILKAMPWVAKKEVEDFVLAHVKTASTFVTDGLTLYNKVGKKMNHIVVDTRISNKTKGKHKNGIENAWRHFRLCIDGTYHSVSDEHMQRYCEEFCYRFNSRHLSDGFRFCLTFHQMEGRLTYKQLTDHGQDEKRENGTPFYPIETGE